MSRENEEKRERTVYYESELEDRYQKDLDYYDGSIKDAYSDPDNDVDEYEADRIFSND